MHTPLTVEAFIVQRWDLGCSETAFNTSDVLFANGTRCATIFFITVVSTFIPFITLPMIQDTLAIPTGKFILLTRTN